MNRLGKLFSYLFVASLAFAGGAIFGFRKAPPHYIENNTIGKQKIKGDGNEISATFTIKPGDSPKTIRLKKRLNNVETKTSRRKSPDKPNHK